MDATSPRAAPFVAVGILIALPPANAVAPAETETRPPPTPVEARWVTAHSDRNPTVSPDGKLLVFSSDRSGRQALYARGMPDGHVSVLVDSGDAPGYAAWSPDGRRLAFTAQVNGQDDIFVIDADGGGRRSLVADPARDGHPRWSPDGERVFFNSERVAVEPRTSLVTAPEGEDRVDIFSVRADGTDLRRHSRCGSECSYPSLSPDGRSLLFRRVFWGPARDADGKPVRNSEIVVTSLDGGNEVNLLESPAYDVYPIWSHDGAWVYFSSNRDAPATQLHLWRVSARGGVPQRLTTGIWSHRQAMPDAAGAMIYLFTYLRSGGADVGYIAAIDVPAD